MNKIFDIFIVTLLIVIANSSAMASTPSVAPTATTNLARTSPKGKSIVAKYECRSRGVNTGQIILRANRSYEAKQQTGKYQQSPLGYRFLTGSLKGQSIVIQNDNIYLVNTKSETRAAEAAAVDGALFCTGSMIYY